MRYHVFAPSSLIALFVIVLVSKRLLYIVTSRHEQGAIFPRITTSGLSEAKFNMSNNDVLIFVHIQKTGGSSFQQYLTNYIDIPEKCKLHERSRDRDSGTKFFCECTNRNGYYWLFTRCTGNWSCGLHPGISSLRQCATRYYEGYGLTQQRFWYMTFLRDPYTRYLSEWLHTTRGATWVGVRPACEAFFYRRRNISLCLNGVNKWRGVTIEEFIGCPTNPATNRMTWMLASLNELGCARLAELPETKLKQELLQSAKQNLEMLDYFGLLEFRNETAENLYTTLGLKLTVEDKVIDLEREEYTTVNEENKRRILQLIDLDIELYNFARKLYIARYHS